jgi:hypothetical protein
MTPDEIYLRAIAFQRSLPVPAYVTYVAAYRADGAVIGCADGHLVVSFEGHGSAATYRVSFRSSDGAARSFDVATNAPCLGFPLISPTGGDIGKLAEPAAGAPRPSENAGPLPLIGSVVAHSALHYRVLAANVETLGDDAVDHLTLRALADPATYALTDLYVDAKTFAVRRIVATFSDRYGGVPATIAATGDFTERGGYWVQSSEHVGFEAQTEPKATRATLDARAYEFAFPSDAPPELEP